MTDSPCILLMSCSDTHPDDIIKLLLDVEILPEKVHIESDIYAFPWIIDNKYYTAEVNVCPFPKRTVASERFAKSVDAVVLHFDSYAKEPLEKVESWLPLIEQYAPEIKILVTKNVPNSDVTPTEGCTRKSVLEWCVGKGFELVELEPINEDDEKEEEGNNYLEDDFPETTGIKRVIQALHAHVWPNLVMKNSTSSVKPQKQVESSLNNFASLGERLGLEESLEELLDGDDDFSHLFSHLSMMKERVSSLSEADRKEAAEQVVKAFWKAMGGDENEFMDN